MRLLATIALLAAVVYTTPASACRIFPSSAIPAIKGSLVESDYSGDESEVLAAYFTEPTDRYGHGVLGDGIEAGALVAANVITSSRCGDLFRLPLDRVFEDIAPRIADVTGDGRADAVVIETSVREGAQLAVYGFVSEDGFTTLRKFAATPHIGRPYRWLAPAGIADFDGDGQNDIAYVETPHIGGILRIWTMRDGDLVEIASAPGYSNHRIGQNFITGGVRDCGNGPELVLPDAGWERTLVARLGGGEIESAVLADNADPETIAWLLECP